MANIKQKFIKPGRDYNYSEGVKVLADTAVYENQVVYVTSSSGPFSKVATADADGGVAANGRLMVAKHNIAAGEYGICLPWRLITDVNTSAAPAVGAPVYLSDTPGSSAASNLVFSAPTGDAQVIVVGRVTVDATAANGGAMLIDPSSPEYRVQGGALTATNTAVLGRPTETLYWTIDDSSTTHSLTMEYPIIITDVHHISGGTTNVTIDLYKGSSGTNSIIDQLASGTDADAIVRADEIKLAYNSIGYNGVIRCVKGATGDATDKLVITFIRA